jgi:hypothetical protein
MEILWYIFLRFGMLCQEKSGNPERNLNGLSSEKQASAQ